MPDEVREYLTELRDNWRDAYWWADHAFLQTVLLCTLAGMIGVAFKALELHIEGRMRPQP